MHNRRISIVVLSSATDRAEAERHKRKGTRPGLAGGKQE